MAISRSQLVKELEPGLNALFGLEYNRYENQHTEIFDTETSDRAFEEEVMLSGFGTAQMRKIGSLNLQRHLLMRNTHREAGRNIARMTHSQHVAFSCEQCTCAFTHTYMNPCTNTHVYFPFFN